MDGLDLARLGWCRAKGLGAGGGRKKPQKLAITAGIMKGSKLAIIVGIRNRKKMAIMVGIIEEAWLVACTLWQIMRNMILAMILMAKMMKSSSEDANLATVCVILGPSRQNPKTDSKPQTFPNTFQFFVPCWGLPYRIIHSLVAIL
jgi:hypothetical protein